MRTFEGDSAAPRPEVEAAPTGSAPALRGGASGSAPALRGGASGSAPALRGGASGSAPALRGGASGREPGRRGKQGETRARLILVTIELLRGEGLSALTTSRIAKAAGIAQPGFYAHFKNVDDLVSTAVLEVLEAMRRKASATRQAAFHRLERYEDLTNIGAMRTAYEEGLELLLGDPTFAELLLRYRRDPSLLGGLLREAMRRVRDDITVDVWRTAQRFGFREEHYPQVQFWSEQILALFLTAAEALLDGRHERASVVDAITRSSFAMMVANVRAAGLHHLIPRDPRRTRSSGSSGTGSS